jgi:GTP-binding protein
VAITGRPNVGKSSFLNKLTASNRTIVSDIPGTTRDTVDTPLDYGGHGFLLVDTAGIRHKRKVRRAVDVYSMMRSEDAVRRADVVFLLLDSKDGFTRDDSVILRMAEKYGKACLVLVNKWDLAEDVPDVDAGVYLKHLLAGSSVLEKYPVNFVSSRTGKNVLSTLSEARELEKLLRQDVSTPSINRIFEKNPPSRVPIPKRKKRPNFLYIVQSGKKPVEFTYFVNDPASVLPAHKSFIENKLRERLPLLGIPVTIKIRSSRKGVDQ